MSGDQTVIWLFGGPGPRGRAAPLLAALSQEARPLTLGPTGRPRPDLVLAQSPDLGLALEACPPELRPGALIWLEPGAPAPTGLDDLPCPRLAWPGGQAGLGIDQVLPLEPGRAAQEALAAARRGVRFPWLEAVQVNLPLKDLLGRYQHLSQQWPVHPEVGLDAAALDRLTPAHLEQARDLLKGRRVSLHLPFMDLVPASLDCQVAQASQRRLLEAAAWGVLLGARQAVAHLGYNPQMHQHQADFSQRLAQALAPVADRLAGGGCALALENTFELDPAPLLQARQALLAAGCLQVGFCLDLGHALAFSRTSLPEWWRALSPHLAELHLHDNDLGGDQHLPPGRGRADWAWLRQRLVEMEVRPLLTLEPHREPHLWGSLRALEHLWGPPWPLD